MPSNSLLSPLCAYFESLSVRSLDIFDLTNSETDSVDGYLVLVKLSFVKSTDLFKTDSAFVTSPTGILVCAVNAVVPFPFT